MVEWAPAKMGMTIISIHIVPTVIWPGEELGSHLHNPLISWEPAPAYIKILHRSTVGGSKVWWQPDFWSKSWLDRLWKKVNFSVWRSSLAVHRAFLTLTLSLIHSLFLSYSLFLLLSHTLSHSFTTFSWWHLEQLSFWYLSWKVAFWHIDIRTYWHTDIMFSDILLTFWRTFVLITKLRIDLKFWPLFSSLGGHQDL